MKPKKKEVEKSQPPADVEETAEKGAESQSALKPAATSGASAAETPTAAPAKSLKSMAAMHADEKPTHDAQLETGAVRRGRPSLNETDEEKRAKRNARDAKRRGLQAPEKKAPEKPALTPEEIKSKLDVSSQAITSTFIGIHAGVFGEKWKNKATGQDDEEILRSGFRAYLEAKEWFTLPPGLLLALSLGAYYIPRLNFKAIWDKVFKKKDGKTVDEKGQPDKPSGSTKPADGGHSQHGKPEILLFMQPPVGEAAGGSGAPDAAQGQ